jgi:hypothetical protein
VSVRLGGRVHARKGDASRWLARFHTAYARKLAIPIFPGSLNVALPSAFEWFATAIVQRTIHFDRAEYGGECDILLIPCVLTNLGEECAGCGRPRRPPRFDPLR